MDPSTAPVLALLTHLDPKLFETKAILKTASAGRQLAELLEAPTDGSFRGKKRLGRSNFYLNIALYRLLAQDEGKTP